MAGGIRDLEVESDTEDEMDCVDEVYAEPHKQGTVTAGKSKGVFSLLRYYNSVVVTVSLQIRI